MYRTILSTFIFVGLICIATPARAAEFRVATDGQAMNNGASFEAKITVDTQGESINAFEGTVTFSNEVLAPLAVREGGSIVNFWVERPRTSASGAMRFSGLIPGGFTGQGFLFSVIFRAVKPGNGTIAVADPRALRNDGAGSPAYARSVDVRVAVSNIVASSEDVPPIEDAALPEPFTPVITRDPELFGGKYVLVFATQDKQSGIDHYEVCERSIHQCVVAENPYPLHYQGLGWNIFVKAVDKTGNERIAALPAFMHLSWYQGFLPLAILGVFMCAFIGSRKFL